MGPIGVAKQLAPFLPNHPVVPVWLADLGILSSWHLGILASWHLGILASWRVHWYFAEFESKNRAYCHVEVTSQHVECPSAVRMKPNATGPALALGSGVWDVFVILAFVSVCCFCGLRFAVCISCLRMLFV